MSRISSDEWGGRIRELEDELAVVSAERDNLRAERDELRRLFVRLPAHEELRLQNLSPGWYAERRNSNGVVARGTEANPIEAIRYVMEQSGCKR